MTPDIAALKLDVADARDRFAATDAALRAELESVAAMAADGVSPVPRLDWSAIEAGEVPADLPDLIRRRGCVVINGVFPREQASAWNAELLAYLAENRADAVTRARRPGRWGEAGPQMYSVYWSRPQVLARQSPSLAGVRAWLNRLWRHGGEFDPDAQCTYADRVRRRTPGDSSLGLGPHIDGGTIGRWAGAGSEPYRTLFAGDPAGFDPFDAAHRPAGTDSSDANACSMFRSWQGWTALTAQGPGDGTLQVVPVSRAIAWVLLRPFSADVPAGSLCGAEASTALWMLPEWHAPLLRALVPIPRVEPGDSVWWHPDLIHAVEAVHTGAAPSNVMYIPSAPHCARNAAFLPRQLAAFEAGRSPPDFPADDLETEFSGRAGIELLTPVGRRQMGLA
jgi:hypothetical protein